MTYRYIHPEKEEIWAAYDAKSGPKFEREGQRGGAEVVDINSRRRV
jgi:hypothetical protein